jgi:DNA-binding GntR family transcriptional regulator
LHEVIIDHLDNEIISKAFRVNWIKIKLIRQNETRLYAELVIPVYRDHMKVIEAIERKDADAAVAAMTAHIAMSRSRAIDMN